MQTCLSRSFVCFPAEMSDQDGQPHVPSSKRSLSTSYLESTPGKDPRVSKSCRHLSALESAFEIEGDLSQIAEPLEGEDAIVNDGITGKAKVETSIISHKYPLPPRTDNKHSRSRTPNPDYIESLPAALVGDKFEANSGEINFGPSVNRDTPASHSVSLLGRPILTMSNTSKSTKKTTDPVKPNDPDHQTILDLVETRFDSMLTGAFNNQSNALESTITTIFSRVLTTLLQPYLEDNKAVETRVNALEDANTEITDRLDAIEEKLAKCEAENLAKDVEIENLKYKMDTQDQKTRKNNLKICGVPEKDEEDAQTMVKELATKLDPKFDSTNVGLCHRVGKPGTKPRPILVKMATIQSRGELFKMRKQLKGHKDTFLQSIYINEDLAPLRSRMFYLCRGLKSASLLSKYWVYDCEIWIRMTQEGDPVKITGLSCLRDFKEHPCYVRLVAPLSQQQMYIP